MGVLDAQLPRRGCIQGASLNLLFGIELHIIFFCFVLFLISCLLGVSFRYFVSYFQFLFSGTNLNSLCPYFLRGNCEVLLGFSGLQNPSFLIVKYLFQKTQFLLQYF